MTEADLAKTLEGLSAAAIQGDWRCVVYDAGDIEHYDHNGPTPGIFSEESDCGIVHWDGFKQKYWSSANGNQRQMEANAELITTLVNAYRTGQLIVVDHPQATSPVDDRGGAVCEQQAVEVPRGVIAFLNGRSPLKGVWFGDKHPTERGAFWWRKYLPTLGDEA